MCVRVSVTAFCKSFGQRERSDAGVKLYKGHALSQSAARGRIVHLEKNEENWNPKIFCVEVCRSIGILITEGEKESV